MLSLSNVIWAAPRCPSAVHSHTWKCNALAPKAYSFIHAQSAALNTHKVDRHIHTYIFIHINIHSIYVCLYVNRKLKQNLCGALETAGMWRAMAAGILLLLFLYIVFAFINIRCVCKVFYCKAHIRCLLSCVCIYICTSTCIYM